MSDREPLIRVTLAPAVLESLIATERNAVEAWLDAASRRVSEEFTRQVFEIATFGTCVRFYPDGQQPPQT